MTDDDVRPQTGRGKLRRQLYSLARAEAGGNGGLGVRFSPTQVAGRLRVLADAYDALAKG